MSINQLFSILKGGPTSGNRGHAGIPGKRGGSAPKGGVSYSAQGINITRIQAGKDITDILSKSKYPLPFIYNSASNTFHISSSPIKPHADFLKNARESTKGIEEKSLSRGFLNPQTGKISVYDMDNDNIISWISGDTRQEQRITKNKIKVVQRKLSQNLPKYNGKTMELEFLNAESLFE